VLVEHKQFLIVISGHMFLHVFLLTETLWYMLHRRVPMACPL